MQPTTLMVWLFNYVPLLKFNSNDASSSKYNTNKIFCLNSYEYHIIYYDWKSNRIITQNNSYSS